MKRRGFFAAIVGCSVGAAAPKVEKPAGLRVEAQLASWICGGCGYPMKFQDIGGSWSPQTMRCMTERCPEFRKLYRPLTYTAAPAPEPKPVAELSPEPRLLKEPDLEDYERYDDWLKDEIRWVTWREQMSARVLL